MRQTMVSSAQSPKFVCVRQKRFLKGLLQNALHFATAPFQPANTSLGFPRPRIFTIETPLMRRFTYFYPLDARA